MAAVFNAPCKDHASISVDETRSELAVLRVATNAAELTVNVYDYNSNTIKASATTVEEPSQDDAPWAVIAMPNRASFLALGQVAGDIGQGQISLGFEMPRTGNAGSTNHVGSAPFQKQAGVSDTASYYALDLGYAAASSAVVASTHFYLPLPETEFSAVEVFSLGASLVRARSLSGASTFIDNNTSAVVVY